MLDATKPQDGVNGNAEGLHGAEGGESGRATGSEVSSEWGDYSQGHHITTFPHLTERTIIIVHISSFQVAQVDAYTNAEQLSQTGQQNGNLKPSGPAPPVNSVDVRNSILHL